MCRCDAKILSTRNLSTRTGVLPAGEFQSLNKTKLNAEVARTEATQGELRVSIDQARKLAERTDQRSGSTTLPFRAIKTPTEVRV